jgi:hypothetical protein
MTRLSKVETYYTGSQAPVAIARAIAKEFYRDEKLYWAVIVSYVVNHPDSPGRRYCIASIAIGDEQPIKATGPTAVRAMLKLYDLLWVQARRAAAG